MMIRTTLISLCFLFLFSIIFDVKAHSWYDSQCCSDKDCSVVLDTQEDGHGNLIVTSKHGTVFISKEFTRRPSQDENDHICIINYNGKLMVLCYYVATGI